MGAVKNTKTTKPENNGLSYKLNVKPKTENQKRLVEYIEEKEIVVCHGYPGSGKTFLSCYKALELLKNNEKYKKIVLIKSVTPLKSEELGYLKGTLSEKMEPFIYSFINNFQKIIGDKETEWLRLNNLIEVLPIAYLRGVNIDNAIIIIDETQNINIDNIRTILTRIGFNSKMIFLGDSNQIDQKNKKENALKFMIEHFSEIDEVGVVEFTELDVIRNPIIKKIEAVFNKYFNVKPLH